jgi:hypothetical protein
VIPRSGEVRRDVSQVQLYHARTAGKYAMGQASGLPKQERQAGGLPHVPLTARFPPPDRPGFPPARLLARGW